MTAFMIVVCSCMPQTSLPTIKAHPDKTTIRIWLWQGSGLESLIQAYKDSHQGIDVEIVTSQYDDIQPNLMIAFATRSDSPDLVLLDSSQINQMKNFPAYFHNLYEYGDEHVHYLDWKWRQAESDDGSFLFALPADIGPVALAYRFDLFAAAGLPAGRTEITAMLGSWDDLE
ncbi:ABC transporter substrate-binding protein, partial [Paenibacillus sepulcri]|nr:ABC transporter substrate-binding protein [Paenibacillus sepulcri]